MRAHLAAIHGTRVIPVSPAIAVLTILAAIALLVARAPVLRAAEDPSSALPAGALTISLDGSDWLLAIDPKNEGTANEWFRGPRPEAVKASRREVSAAPRPPEGPRPPAGR
jgi:hypothetical protein